MTAVQQAFADLSGKNLIDGAERASASTDGITVIDPAFETSNGEIPNATADEIEEAVAAANRAQKAWTKVNGLTRSELLHEVAHKLRAMRHDLAEAMTREMGKPYKESADEVEWSATAFDYYAEVGRHDCGRVIGPVVDGQTHLVTKHPLGVVTIIMAFNYPYTLYAWQAAAALATGNAVILKPSEMTTLCSMMMLRALDHFPPGLVQCVNGDYRVGSALTEHEDVHCVAFTGSIRAGQAVNAACAPQFKRALIECSGNDPFIVMPSAPMDIVARGAVFSAYINCGQICARAERFFVHEAVHDEFVERVTDLSKQLRIGPGLEKVDIGPMVSAKERDRFEGLVKRAIDAGGQVQCGGGRPSEFNRGFFVEPTVLAGIDPAMEIMNTETFGPVIPISKVSDFDEALACANNSKYALGSVVYTTDLKETTRAMEELHAGMTWINAPLLDNDAGPFGGWKMSGTGSQLGSEGLDQFRENKLVMIDPNCSDHDFWWYPYKDEEAYPNLSRNREAGMKHVKDMVAEANEVVDHMPATEAMALLGADDVVFVDLRDPRELKRDGMIPGAFHCTRGMLEFWIDPESPYAKDVFREDKRFVFYCASGWRSALSAKTAQDMGLTGVTHIVDGFGGWKKAGGPVAEKE